MTEADHADISRRLALAIEWPESSIYVALDSCLVLLGSEARYFDYRDPVVIWRVAERYDAFPVRLDATRWAAMCGKCGTFCYGYTAAESVARAVLAKCWWID